jgi:hypothetical protein
MKYFSIPIIRRLLYKLHAKFIDERFVVLFDSVYELYHRRVKIVRGTHTRVLQQSIKTIHIKFFALNQNVLKEQFFSVALE